MESVSAFNEERAAMGSVGGGHMNHPKAVFGFPKLWDAAFEAHAAVYFAIDKVQMLANELIGATKDTEAELMQVMRALTSVNGTGMSDVLILTGNGRGTGAMKVARSMFEVSITAEYLEKNRLELDLYLDFAHVIAWRQLQQVERNSPSRISPELMREAEAQYNRVKVKFESNGRVRNNWSEKSIKKMAEDIGRTALYDIAYGLASMLHHVNAGGLIGHDLNWEGEALRIGHGSLLQTITALYNAHDERGTEFRERLDLLIIEFSRVWKEHAAARDERSPI